MASPEAPESMDGEQQEALNRYAERNRQQDERSEIIQAVPPVLMRGALYAFIAAILIAGAVSYFTKIYVKVQAKGEIVPQGQNITVEAIEGGVVLSMNVAEGDTVKQGDLIMLLQRSQSDVDLKGIENALALEIEKQKQLETSTRIAREIVEDPSILGKRPASSFVDAGAALVYIHTLRSSQKQLETAQFNIAEFERSGAALARSQIQVNLESIDSQQKSLDTSRQMLATRNNVLERRRKDLRQTEELAAQRIVPITQVDAARDSMITAQGSVITQRQAINETELEISRARLAVANLRSDLAKRERELRDEVDRSRVAVNQALADLASSVSTFTNTANAVNAEIANFQNKLNLQKMQIDQLRITSPVDGTITGLGFQTTGRIVSTGNMIATIVPHNARPIVVAIVANKDVAFVREDIAARVKVDAYPYRQFGSIPAKVVKIYPRPDRPEFAVRLELEKATLKVRGEAVALRPGLTVEVDLLTDRRRIIELILKKMD
ncbi:MAG: HlyD family efflux transporter periplasmic adaptor subunit [Rhodospirillales bacterium]